MFSRCNPQLQVTCFPVSFVSFVIQLPYCSASPQPVPSTVTISSRAHSISRITVHIITFEAPPIGSPGASYQQPNQQLTNDNKQQPQWQPHHPAQFVSLIPFFPAEPAQTNSPSPKLVRHLPILPRFVPPTTIRLPQDRLRRRLPHQHPAVDSGLDPRCDSRVVDHQ